jgi:hypothetical protein
MSCPHGVNGDPRRCSQCLGARPRVIRRDEVRGVFTIDGVDVGTIREVFTEARDRDTQKLRDTYSPSRTAPKPPSPERPGQRRQQRCSSCGELGHKRTRCEKIVTN